MFDRQNLTVSGFLAVFRPVLVFYAWWKAGDLDWIFYDRFAASLYHPVGLFETLRIPWPGLIPIHVLLLVAGVSGLCWIVGFERKIAPVFFTMAIFFLDGIHNMFGFVDAQIHMVYFLAAASWMEHEREGRLFESRAFQFCEVVFVLVYLQSGLSKLIDGGWDWALQGGTLQIGLIRQQAPLGLLLAGSSHLAIALSLLTLIFELAFPLLYWLNRRHPAIYFASAAFHMGVFLMMGIDFFHLWSFAFAMILAQLNWRGIYGTGFKSARAV